MCQHDDALVNCVCAAWVSRRLIGGDLLLPQMALARITCHDNPFYSRREMSTSLSERSDGGALTSPPSGESAEFSAGSYAGFTILTVSRGSLGRVELHWKMRP